MQFDSRHPSLRSRSSIKAEGISKCALALLTFQCVYDSLDQACTNCVRRRVPCGAEDKTYGQRREFLLKSTLGSSMDRQPIPLLRKPSMEDSDIGMINILRFPQADSDDAFSSMDASYIDYYHNILVPLHTRHCWQRGFPLRPNWLLPDFTFLPVQVVLWISFTNWMKMYHLVFSDSEEFGSLGNLRQSDEDSEHGLREKQSTEQQSVARICIRAKKQVWSLKWAVTCRRYKMRLVMRGFSKYLFQCWLKT